MLIAILGIDGSGKSTVVEFLTRKLNQLSKTTYKASFPSQWLLDMDVDFERSNSTETIALFAADIGRSQPQIELALTKNDYVILDRYHYCTYAYNCESVLDTAIYEGLTRTFIKPDLTVFIDVPIIEALNRIVDRDDSQLNYFERKDLLENAATRYKQKISRINYEQMLIVNGSQLIDDIVSDILIKIKAIKVTAT